MRLHFTSRLAKPHGFPVHNVRGCCAAGVGDVLLMLRGCCCSKSLLLVHSSGKSFL